MQSAIDLKIWKELAISKQLLIRTATDALGISPECQEDELKTALIDGVKKIANADSIVQSSKQESQAVLDSLEKKLADSEKARMIEEGRYRDMLAKKETLDKLLEETRKINADELKSVSTQLEDKNKALKSIKVALADTPENVVKKLKALNKKKFDETTARKRAEDETRGLRKEKQEIKDKHSALEKTVEEAGKLAEKHRELHLFTDSQYTQLKALIKDKDELKAVPELDENLLKSLEPGEKVEENKKKEKKEKKEKIEKTEKTEKKEKVAKKEKAVKKEKVEKKEKVSKK